MSTVTATPSKRAYRRAVRHLERERPYNEALLRAIDLLRQAQRAVDAVLALDPDAYPHDSALAGSTDTWAEVVADCRGLSWSLECGVGLLDSNAPVPADERDVLALASVIAEQAGRTRQEARP
jgi:hypothetical protein